MGSIPGMLITCCISLCWDVCGYESDIMGLINVTLLWWMCMKHFGHVTPLDNQRHKDLSNTCLLILQWQEQPFIRSLLRMGKNWSPSKPISAFLNSSFKGPSHFEEMHSNLHVWAETANQDVRRIDGQFSQPLMTDGKVWGGGLSSCQGPC